LTVQLNHTIVPATDKDASARFLAGILGVVVEAQWGPFVPVVVDNDVTLDFADADEVHAHHYAFIVGDDEFDAIFGRVKAAGLTYWADPHHQHPDAINHNDGGRGFYFDDPDGHLMEVITRPYGRDE
jgi:catechol 2,3-dioxygenase-like lactoylglutathione lyase family enzyme